MRILDSFFEEYRQTDYRIVTADQVDELEAMIGELFVYSFIWSIGITGNTEGRKGMNLFLRDKIKEAEIEFPEDATIYDWCFDPKKASWLGWTETQKEFKVDTKLNYSEIVVPTDDSIRMKFLLKNLITKGKHVLTPGPTGTGKTVNIIELVS